MKLASIALKAPILLYRYTFSVFLGRTCRYLPTCSEYTLDAIDRNGAWRGAWLGLARVCRCSPLGGAGYDPAPDLIHEHHPWWAPWRYGRWRCPEQP